ncbi:hypothetical protein [Salinispira pacifica]
MYKKRGFRRVLAAAVLIFVCGAATLAAQETADQPNLQAIDFSKATISQAGPESFYVRQVKIEGSEYSLFVARNSDGNWAVTKIVPESDNVLPPNVMLDFASVTRVSSSSVVVDGIILDGKIYQGTLDVTGPGSTVVLSNLSPGSLTDRAVATADQFRQLLLSDETKRFQQELEAQRQELQARNDRLQSQIDSLTAERDNLQQQLADAQSTGSTDEQLTKRVNELLAANKALTDNNAKLLSQNQELLKKNQALQTENQNLMSSGEAVGSDAALRDLVNRLQAGKADLDRANQQLAAQVDSLKSLVSGLQTQNASLLKQVGELQSELAGLKASFPAQYGVTQEQFSQEADRLQSQLAALQSQISSVSRQIGAGGADAGRSDAAAGAPSPGATDSQLRTQIAQLQAENRQLKAQKADLEQNIRRQILEKGYIGLYRPLFNKLLYSGFHGGDPQLGSWQDRAGTLYQYDSRQYFAKYALPVPQVSRPTLYTMQLRAAGSGWVGVGLHIFASDVQSRKGYGMGRSLLVWLTRDRNYYKNDGTYLQLYRSDDDVNMGRVLDAKIAESISDYLTLEVLYEPDREYITIAVNGQEKVRYKTWFGVDSGVTVALRTLGAGASFRDFEVKTIEPER